MGGGFRALTERCGLYFPCGVGTHRVRASLSKLVLEAPPSRGTHIPVTSIAAESKFVELVRGWLVSLPHDLKIAFDAMDDENLPRPVRELAAGLVMYIVTPKD